jgi:streptogramin lyase
MRLAALRIWMCLLCVAATSILLTGVSNAASQADAGDGPLTSQLVIPEEEALAEGQQQAAAQEALRQSAEAIKARKESQTKFRGLTTPQAAHVDAEEFPGVVDIPAGGAPSLPTGQKITGYLSDNAASVALGGGMQGVIESTAPIAVQNSSGQRTPIDLGLRESKNGFEPATPAVEVSIPKRLSNGVALASMGLSLTPSDGSGTPLGGSEGTIDGMTVLYADTQADMDSLIKPTTGGFAAETLLRSPESPSQLFFRVGLPAGARLEEATDGSGAVDVLDDGAVMAVIAPPAAYDAAGTAVPVSMSLQGDIVVLSVDQHSTEYQWPIDVDPEVTGTDSQIAITESGRLSNWEFGTSSVAKFGYTMTSGASPSLETYGHASYGAGEKAYWGYQTQGISKIWEFTAETEAKNTEDHIESFLELEAHGSGSQENKELLSDEAEKTAEYGRRAAAPICPKKEDKGEQQCVASAGGAGNAVRFQQSTTAASSKYNFSDTLYQGVVSLSEPAGTHSTASYNTKTESLLFEAEHEGKKVKQERTNALYGSGSWLSEYSGAIELEAKDTGIGVSATRLEYESAPGKWETLMEHNYLSEGLCKGVQCFDPEHIEYWTLNERLPNGEDKIRYRAEEALEDSTHGTESPETEGVASVKVDNSRPSHILLQGLPYGNELSERVYKLTAKATDGQGTTVPSSGVKSIELFIDGHTRTAEKEGGTGECTTPHGECTASQKYEINGAELGAGHHAIVIVVKDNAGSEARSEQEISIRHSTPVAIGPGSVDLESGDFTLGASDASMGSGLTVSRNYSSRDVQAGDEGPLGPEWSLSLSSTETLHELVDGSVLMTAANGSQTVFATLGEGKFESPPGDSNLTLRLEENKETKAKEAYYLEDAANHTKAKFTLPSAASTEWVPTVQEGAVATDTDTYKYKTAESLNEYALPSSSSPMGIATGPDGDVWFVDHHSSKVGKITTAGVVTEYALPSGSDPWEIAASPDGNMWFTDWNSGKVGQISRYGKITEYALPSGAAPEGIAAGPDGNMWFTEVGKDRIAKITPSGTITEYPVQEAQRLIAGPDGNMWFTNAVYSKIGKITMSGVVTEYALPEKSEPVAITAGTEGDLWFEDAGTFRIGKITVAGETAEYALPTHGTENFYGLTAGPDGDVWFAYEGGNTVGKITKSGTVTEYTVPSGSHPSSITVGPDGNMWFTDLTTSKIGEMTTSDTIAEPSEALAPVPAGVSCTWTTKPTEMKPGCRALEFQYATETTATGEAESEWGEYAHRLTKVSAVAYNATSKEMKETPVAEYRYDKRGRLRAEWDPRVSPALKTSYGYDEYGHITALNPAGQEPWTFTYGAAVADAGSGRLLKVARAQPASGASEETVKKQISEDKDTLESTEAPAITGSTVVGGRLAVSNGKWAGNPISYAYQWEDCSATTGSCTPIVGATNANYTPVATDVGDTLIAQVTASNESGSLSSHSAASSAVNTTIGSEYALPEESGPREITTGPDGNLWITDYLTSKVSKVTPAGGITEFALPHNSYPDGIAAGPDGNLWLADLHSNEISKLSTSGTVTEYSLPEESYPEAIASGAGGDLWYTAGFENKIGKITTAGVRTEYSVPESGGKEPRPAGIALGPDGNMWFVDSGTSKIGKITPGGVITEFSLPAGSAPFGITAGPDGNLWFTEQGTSRVGRITTSGVVSEYALPSNSQPEGITAGTGSSLWFAERGTSRLGRITTAGAITECVLPAGSDPTGVTKGPEGSIWYTAMGTSKVGKVTFTEGEYHAPQPGTTIDYDVPLEGGAAPAQMGINALTQKPEPEKWGQTEAEDPVEAAAIFPPDEPQSWPALGYKRATVYYLDEQGRQVNVATPSTAPYGSIATTEYNEYNDVMRTLTPDNRATALAAGSSSEEVSKLLDTESRYNEPECSVEQPGQVAEPGTRLCETLGPQHEVKYVPNGFHETRESLARNHEEFFYDQGVPKEKPYDEETFDLVTETSDLALLANREDVEVRTTKTSYSGQGNRGWKLREPTSVTIDPRSKEGNPTGLNLTSTTLYNEQGQVTETRGAAAEHTLTYASKFGEKGSEPGKLNDPWGVAVDAKGDIWTSNTANSNIEEFGPEGKYITKISEAGSEPGKLDAPEGIAIDSKGNIWIADTGNNNIEEFSPEGKYEGQITARCTEGGKLKTPSALAFDSEGRLWVADTGNNKIERYKEGKCVSEFGSAGSEPGKLDEPTGIAIDAEGHPWVANSASNVVEEFSTSGSLLAHFGAPGSGEGQLNGPEGIAFDASGDLWISDGHNGRIEAFSPASGGGYASQAGWSGTGQGQLSQPRAIAFDAHGDAWVTDSANNRLEEFSPGANAHDKKTVYYSSEPNTEEGFSGCGKHPEWAGLVCETLPSKQPELASLPRLPITTTTYNMLLEPETLEEKFTYFNAEHKEETVTRTEREGYDEAGRLKTSETTASIDKTLPKVTLGYNGETGSLETQAAGGETITSEHNRLGQLVKYTDANGNTTTYKYAGPENDDLLEELSDGHEELHEGKERKSFQRYSYNETTKALVKLEDSAAGTFTASYDAEGKMTSEIYPNNMCANYTFNSVGEATSVQYLKTANCSESAPALWYSDSRISSIHGQMLSQTSTLANETYSYDEAERLTEVQETVAGEGCTTRSYAYDEESDRASLTTRKPGSKGECLTEGGTTEAHNYDESNRLTDPETTYEPLGNITKLPATDAEGDELTSSFYVDNAVAEQTQNGVTHKYNLDPEGRDNETTTGSKKLINHYDAPGEAIAWTSEEEGKTTTRDIPSIDGTLTAIQTNNETPVLQLHDLQGDIVATIGDSASETKLRSTYNSTEFGTPSKGKAPPPYAWLGAGGVKSELASGVITEGATSYVPQTGRPLQSEEVVPPGLPDGSGGGAPVTFQEEPWVMEGATREANEAPGLEAGREREAWEAALAASLDPVIHYRAWEAKDKAAAIRRDLGEANLVEAVTALFSTPTAYLKGIAEGFFTTNIAYEWIEEYGLFLEACVRELHGIDDSHGGCRADYKTVDFLGLEFANFFSKPLISWCSVGKANGDSIDNLELTNCELLGYANERAPIV